MFSLSNFKRYFIELGLVLSAIAGAVIVYYKRKMFVENTLTSTNKVAQDIDKDKAQVSEVDDQLVAQEAKRKEIQDAKDDVPATPDDLVNFFANRK